jgi:hypothetical protein
MGTRIDHVPPHGTDVILTVEFASSDGVAEEAKRTAAGMMALIILHQMDVSQEDLGDCLSRLT